MDSACQKATMHDPHDSGLLEREGNGIEEDGNFNEKIINHSFGDMFDACVTRSLDELFSHGEKSSNYRFDDACLENCRFSGPEHALGFTFGGRVEETHWNLTPCLNAAGKWQMEVKLRGSYEDQEPVLLRADCYFYQAGRPRRVDQLVERTSEISKYIKVWDTKQKYFTELQQDFLCDTHWAQFEEINRVAAIMRTGLLAISRRQGGSNLRLDMPVPYICSVECLDCMQTAFIQCAKRFLDALYVVGTISRFENPYGRAFPEYIRARGSSSCLASTSGEHKRKRAKYVKKISYRGGYFRPVKRRKIRSSHYCAECYESIDKDSVSLGYDPCCKDSFHVSNWDVTTPGADNDRDNYDPVRREREINLDHYRCFYNTVEEMVQAGEGFDADLYRFTDEELGSSSHHNCPC